MTNPTSFSFSSYNYQTKGCHDVPAAFRFLYKMTTRGAAADLKVKNALFMDERCFYNGRKQHSRVKTAFYDGRKQFSHVKTAFYHGRKQLSRVKTPFYHGRKQLSHVRTPFYHGRKQLSHARTLFYQKNQSVTN